MNLDNAIYVPLFVLACGVVGYFIARRASRKFDEKYGVDPE